MATVVARGSIRSWAHVYWLCAHIFSVDLVARIRREARSRVSLERSIRGVASGS